MKYDEIISNGRLSGEHLALWRTIADYSLNGSRLGSVELQTKSGTDNDVFLAKGIAEIHLASLVLARAGFGKLALTSVDSAGRKLERPDFNVRLPDGTEIGLEVTRVTATAHAKHEAAMVGIERALRDLLDTDQRFAETFGNYYLDVTLSNIDTRARAQIASKGEAAAIQREITAFVLAGEHRTSSRSDLLEFSSAYPTLSSRGALYFAERSDDGPHFTLSDGAGPIDPMCRPEDVLRILDRHRRAATGYRTVSTWIVLLLTDHFEFFRNTIAKIAQLNPPVDPFAKAYFADTAGRLLELPAR